MKTSMLAITLTLLSLNTFAAAKTEFKSLNCVVTIDSPKAYEKAFNLKITFKDKVNAINNSGLLKSLPADIEVTYLHDNESGLTKKIQATTTFGQETSAFGHEIHTSRKMFGSDYETNLSLTPNFKGFFSPKNLDSYSATLEVNAKIGDNDASLMTTGLSAPLKCTPAL